MGLYQCKLQSQLILQYCSGTTLHARTSVFREIFSRELKYPAPIEKWVMFVHLFKPESPCFGLLHYENGILSSLSRLSICSPKAALFLVSGCFVCFTNSRRTNHCNEYTSKHLIDLSQIAPSSESIHLQIILDYRDSE